ncbi:MAG: NTP transferase domain-containing protein [Polyangiaceae bacterium]|nr:NTP transferase domain-containing protein [Polyangiaceae bacterium]
MQAVILAGGLASRLGARTASVPKSLLSIAGRPFIDWQLARLVECGFTEVVLCVGHLGDAVRAHVDGGAVAGLRVSYSYDGPRLLGTAGALRRALPRLDPCFLVTYGDSYLPFDYGAPLRDLLVHPDALGTMSVFPNAGRWDASNTAIVGDRVAHYEKGSREPALDHIDYGATALRREVIAALPPNEPHGLDAVQAELAARGRLRALLATERFYEIGSEAGIEELEGWLGRE